MSIARCLCALTLVLVCALVSAQHPSSVLDAPRDLSRYTYADYQREFPKLHASATAATRAKSHFHANLATILRLNDAYLAGTQTWFAGVNAFTDQTVADLPRGYRPSRLVADAPSADLQLADEQLPPSIDWREKGVVSTIKNQGGCGSCWAFAATEVLESHLAIATGGPVVTLSEQQFVACTPNPSGCGGKGGCAGAVPQLAFNFTRDHGIVLETDYPYAGTAGDGRCNAGALAKVVATVAGYAQLQRNNGRMLQAALAQRGPVAVTVAASGQLFMFYQGGVASGNCGNDVDHTVVAVGYGVDAKTGLGFWLVRNSWGGNWGEGGYIRLLRQLNATEPCGTDWAPLNGFGCPGGPATIQTCGTCGVLSDSAYPVGTRLVHREN